MRLISQNQTVDVPYEGTVITVNDSYIHAYNPATQVIMMGRYSSEEKALRVMERLREAYINCNTVPHTKSYSGAVALSAYVKNVIFQFPRDEEVEL